MDIKTAIKTFKAYCGTTFESSDEFKEAKKTILNAVAEGYDLIKKDEIIKKLEEVKENYYFVMAMDKAIEIVKEACE